MRSLIPFLLFPITITLHAQWPTYPDNPLLICDAANGQSKVRAISDGTGGWFVFWLDARLDLYKTELYGHHLDEDGNALWASGGLLIASHADSTITHCAPLLMPDGTLLVGYIYGSGGGYDGRVMVQRYNASGAPLWADPVILCHSGNGAWGNIFGFGQLQAFVNGNNAFFAWSLVPQGGNDIYAYERIDVNGNVQFGDLGNAVPSSGWGPFTFHDDLDGGLIFTWRQGNGAGAPLLAMRMNADGDADWGANLNVSQNTSGLNYTFTTTPAENGSFVSVFMSNSDLPMARFDTAGLFVWTPTPLFACDESHGQADPVAILNDGSLFVAWSDSRPPAANADLYLQKFDMNGAEQWTADGVAAIQTSTYIPTPGIVPSDEGAVIVTYDATAPGFCARRVLSGGTPDWPSFVPFCTSTFNPFYEDQVKLPDGEGGVVAFWSNQNAVYGARIFKNGELGNHIGLEEPVMAGSALVPHPSPTDGAFSVALPDRSQPLSVRAIDAQGRASTLPSTRNGDRLQLDASFLADGLYTLEVVSGTGTRTGRFLIVR